MARPARVIHPRPLYLRDPAAATALAALIGAQQTVQQPAPAAVPAPQPRSAPQRPRDASTMDEALHGLMGAAAPKLVQPRFTDTSGPWIRLGTDQVRVPRDVIVSVTRARDGRHIAVVAHLDNSAEAGRVQVLVDSSEGIRELVGLAPPHLAELRRTHFGVDS